MYEHRRAPLLPFQKFLQRLLVHFSVAGAIVVGSLALGMWGYEHFERLGWRDAFLNASMLLGGMGPIDTNLSEPGKLFAGFYALYSGLIFLAATGVVFAPIFHRLLHRFHLESEQ